MNNASCRGEGNRKVRQGGKGNQNQNECFETKAKS